MQTDEAFRQKARDYSKAYAARRRDRYHTDEAFREEERARRRAYYQRKKALGLQTSRFQALSGLSGSMTPVHFPVHSVLYSAV
eukprot:SAG22_NODE_157_length_16986_cov_17.230177_4_plen_83_part_00